MTGSPLYQVQRLYRESGISKIGCSKHADKENFRVSFHKKATWNDIGQNTGIYSYSTADAYRDVWLAAFKFIKHKFGIRDIELIEGFHVADFLYEKTSERIKLATYKQYASALRKLSVALNMYAENNSTGRRYDFNPDIEKVSTVAAKELERFDGVRAYPEPDKLIGAINDIYYLLIALVQHDGGARIDEVFGIVPASFKGIGMQPFTGKEAGIVTVQGKGGKIRDIYIGVSEYNLLKAHVNTHGNNHFDKNQYRKALQEAAEATKQPYTGSHGLRWNFAKNRMKDAQKNGKYYEQGLSAVSQEMGHVRADITEHYLKS